MNVPPIIGMVLSRSQNPVEALRLLQTVMTVEDVHNLVEVILTDMHNDRVSAIMEAARRRKE